MHYSAWVMYSH